MLLEQIVEQLVRAFPCPGVLREQGKERKPTRRSQNTEQQQLQNCSRRRQPGAVPSTTHHIRRGGRSGRAASSAGDGGGLQQQQVAPQRRAPLVVVEDPASAARPRVQRDGGRRRSAGEAGALDRGAAHGNPRFSTGRGELVVSETAVKEISRREGREDWPRFFRDFSFSFSAHHFVSSGPSRRQLALGDACKEHALWNAPSPCRICLLELSLSLCFSLQLSFALVFMKPKPAQVFLWLIVCLPIQFYPPGFRHQQVCQSKVVFDSQWCT